ncbi:MAG: NAD(P)-dependent alcohol dehydrogenase, partial [Cytophagaceae bacterium]
MRASVYTAYGPPEIVQIKEVARPIPKENEVLIKVHATTVNRTDCGFRSAEYFIVRFFSGLFRPKQPILGNEFAGEVTEVGKAVTAFKSGDRVFGYNDSQFGAHAAYMVMAENAAIAPMPPAMTYE